MRNRMVSGDLPRCILMIGFAVLAGPSTMGCIQENPTQQSTGNQQPSRNQQSPGEEKDEPDQIAGLESKASIAFSKGQYQEAADTATRICELSPNSVSAQMFLGETSFAAGEMEKCVAAYDEVIRLQPALEPRLWQRGLALYYADRFADGVEQFETHQTVNSQDVENAVWHLLCAAQISDVDQARKKLIPISRDSRVPMSQIYELFAGRMTPDDVLKAGEKTSARVPDGSTQQKLQLYYAHLYTGLYHEMLGKPEEALASLNKAKEINPMNKTNFMGQVARVHLELRTADAEKK